MTWDELRNMAHRRVDRLWSEYQQTGRGAPPQRAITELSIDFVTRGRVERLWKSDPEAVRRHAEENGVEDVLDYPLSEAFFEEVGEAILDQVGGEMLMRFIDLRDGRATPDETP